MLDTPSQAPLASVRSLSALQVLVPRLSLRRSATNLTLGLLHFVHPNSREVVRIFLGQPMPHPDAPFLRSGGIAVSPIVAAYLSFAGAFERDPLFALAQYMAVLDWQIDAGNDALGFLADERREWRERYRSMLQAVIERSAIPEDRTRHEYAHFFWQDYPEDAVGRPEFSIGGLSRIPVYKLLWPLYGKGRPMPGGHPRKAGICPDRFSGIAEQNTRLCVNPLHFESTELQHKLVLEEWWRPGIERRSTRRRWDYSDFTYKDGKYYCPKEHTLDKDQVDEMTQKNGVGRVTCRACATESNLTLQERGRHHVGYRNRWAPTIPEIHEEADMLRQIRFGEQRSHHKQDDELSDEEWIAQQIAEGNIKSSTEPDDYTPPDPYTAEF